MFFDQKKSGNTEITPLKGKNYDEITIFYPQITWNRSINSLSSALFWNKRPTSLVFVSFSGNCKIFAVNSAQCATPLPTPCNSQCAGDRRQPLKTGMCQCASSQLLPHPQSAIRGTRSWQAPCISSKTRACRRSFSSVGTLKLSSS